MKINTSHYIHTLTPLRGMAALWVVVFHFDITHFFVGLSPMVSATSTMLIGKGYLWVDFFFLLSGFIMTHVYGKRFTKDITYPHVRDYLVSRFSRLYPLHLFCLAIHILFYAYLQFDFPGLAEKISFIYPWEGIPIHIVMGQALGSQNGLSWNAPSWSISAEWWTYGVAVFLFPLIHQRKIWRSAIATVISMLILALIIIFHEKHSLDVTFDFGTMRCLAEFSLGIVLYQLYQSDTGRQWLEKDISFMISMGLVLTLLHSTWTDLLIIPGFGLLILSAAYNRQHIRQLMNTRPLRFIGDISFSIYMMQMLWLSIYWVSLHAWVQETQAEDLGLGFKLFWMVLLLAANILSAAWTYRYIEIPARKWLRKKLGKATPTLHTVSS